MDTCCVLQAHYICETSATTFVTNPSPSNPPFLMLQDLPVLSPIVSFSALPPHYIKIAATMCVSLHRFRVPLHASRRAGVTVQGSQRDTERLGLSPGPRPRSQGSAFPSVLSDSAPQHSSAPSQSVQFSRSVVSDSLRPHGLQHTRLPCPSPTPGACSNSCPLSW